MTEDTSRRVAEWAHTVRMNAGHERPIKVFNAHAEALARIGRPLPDDLVAGVRAELTRGPAPYEP